MKGAGVSTQESPQRQAGTGARIYAAFVRTCARQVYVYVQAGRAGGGECSASRANIDTSQRTCFIGQGRQGEHAGKKARTTLYGVRRRPSVLIHVARKKCSF